MNSNPKMYKMVANAKHHSSYFNIEGLPFLSRECINHKNRNAFGNSTDPAAPPSVMCGDWLSQDLIDRFPKIGTVVPISRSARTQGISIKTDFLSGFCVLWSHRARDVLHSLEPDRHQWSEVTLVGEKLDRDYTFFFHNCLNWVSSDDLYDVSMRPLPAGIELNPSWLTSRGDRDMISIAAHVLPPLRRSRVQNCHLLLQGLNFLPSTMCSPEMIVSDEFRRLSKERGLFGMDFYGPYPISENEQ